MAETTPKEVVLKLIEMINGNVPREQASDCLDPLVTIHMDSAIHQGIEMWQKWIYLIRNSGRVRELRMVPCEVSCDAQDPCVVNLVIRWTGIRWFDKSTRETTETYRLRYRVERNRIVDPFSIEIVARLYRFRWQIELCFKEWKSYANLHQFDTANPHIAEGSARRC